MSNARTRPPSNPLRYEKSSHSRRTVRQRPGPDASYHTHHHGQRKIGSLTGHFIAAVGEFVGTILFLWFAFAWHQTISSQNTDTSTNALPSASTILYISIGYGFSLLVNAFAFYRISGGLFNPAVTFGMVLTRSLPAVRGLFLFPAQILGGIVAAALVSCMFPGDIAATQTLLAPNTSVTRGVFIEMFLTALLLFTIHMLAAEKSKVTYLAPLGIGLSLFVAELAGVGYTGGSLNPARSFGPAVVAKSFPTYHWIYWIGPMLGAMLSAGFYAFITAFPYSQANPDQDSAGGEFVRENSQRSNV